MAGGNPTPIPSGAAVDGSCRLTAEEVTQSLLDVRMAELMAGLVQAGRADALAGAGRFTGALVAQYQPQHRRGHQ